MAIIVVQVNRKEKDKSYHLSIENIVLQFYCQKTLLINIT